MFGDSKGQIKLRAKQKNTSFFLLHVCIQNSLRKGQFSPGHRFSLCLLPVLSLRQKNFNFKQGNCLWLLVQFYNLFHVQFKVLVIEK